jgi:hypothetical protein
LKLHGRSQKKKKLMFKKANTKMFYKFNEKSKNQIIIIVIIIIIKQLYIFTFRETQNAVIIICLWYIHVDIHQYKYI